MPAWDRRDKGETYSALRHLVSAIFPSSDRSKYMALITANLDETGHHDDPSQKVAGMAGIIGESVDLIEFERRWKEALRDAKVPLFKDNKEPYFHMREFVHTADTFSTWKGQRARCEKLFDKLLTIIEASHVIPFGSIMPLDAWRKLTKEQQKYLINPYYFSAHDCLWTIMSLMMNRPFEEKVKIVFSEKEKVKKQIREIFDANRREVAEVRRRISDPIFEDMRPLPALQGADAVAYALNREFRRRLFNPEQEPDDTYQRLVKIQKRMVKRPDDLFSYWLEADVNNAVKRIAWHHARVEKEGS